MLRLTRLPKLQTQVTLFLALMIASLPLQVARAQSSYPNGLVPAEETVQGSLFLIAPQVTIEGTVDGDVFAISQNVILTGEIKGSLFVLSTAATIDGQLAGDLFTANSRLTLGPLAGVGRSAYAAVGMIAMLSGSQVDRDLYLIALSGELSGAVGRYTRAHLGFLELLVLLFGDTGLLRPILPPSFRLPLSAMDTLIANPAERALQWSTAASAAWLPTLALRTALAPHLQTDPLNSAALNDWLIARLRDFAPLLLIGLILLWLFPRFLQGSTERLRSRPLGSFGVGVVTFFIGYGIATLSLALAVALGLFFASINYWDLALISWGAGLGGLSVALALFGLAIIYLSKIIVAYLFGVIILSRLPDATWGRRFWMLLLGLVVGVLLLSIPILGWVLSVLATMFSLGAIYLHLRQHLRLSGTQVQKQPTSVATEQIALVAPVEILEPIETRTISAQEILVGAFPEDSAPIEDVLAVEFDIPAEVQIEPITVIDTLTGSASESTIAASVALEDQVTAMPEIANEFETNAAAISAEPVTAVTETVEIPLDEIPPTIVTPVTGNETGDGSNPSPRRSRSRKSN